MATSSTDQPFPHDLEDAAWANGPEHWHTSFRLKNADLVIIRRQRTASSRLGLALQLGCVRQFGAFVGDLTLLPGEVLRLVSSEIDIADSREALDGYRRSAAAARHRALVRAHLGFRELGQSEVALGITRWLLGRVWHRDERPEVLQELLVARLRREKVLLPAVNTLERLVARCRARMERRLWRRLARLPSPEEAMRLENLLTAAEDAPLSNSLEQLRRGPQRVSSEGLLEAIERLETVRTVGGETWDLGEIPSIRLSRLAGEVDFTSGWDLRRMSPNRRLAVLVAYVHRLRQETQDDVLSILDLHLRMVMSRLQRKERRERLRTRTELNHAARDLALACAPLIDPAVEDAEVRKAAWLRVSKPRIQAAMVSVAELAVEGDQGLARLAGRNAELRRFLPRLLAALRLEANASGRGVLEAWRYLHRIEGKRQPDLGMAPTDFLRGPWKGLVWNSDGTLDRGLYSWAVLDHLRDALRRRDVFAPESRDHRDPRRQLLSGRQWRARRGAVLRTLDLPDSWAAALEDLSQDLLRAYWRADAVLDRPGGPRLVEHRGRSRPSIPKLAGLTETEGLAALRKDIASSLPVVDLSELLLEVDAWTSFTDAMVEARRGTARGAGSSRSLCAVLLSQACNIGLRSVSDPHDPALSLDRLEWVRQRYVAGESILAANDRLVDAHSRLPLAKVWGRGHVASADGLRFVVPGRSAHAAPNPRYFGRRRGITYYNFVSDQYSGFHAVVVSGTIRDSLFVLDGLLEQGSRLEPQELMVDTAGYSDVVFGLFWLLGFQFSPRLRDLSDVRFWRLGPTAELRRMNALAPRKIRPDRIESHWEDLLRIAGSLQQGQVRASDFMRSLQAGGRVSRLRQAIVELGRIVKTIYLLGYLADAEERRRVLTQLNRGESRHALARTIFFGRRGELRQTYRPGQEDQLGALGLVVNAVIHWNAVYTSEVLSAMARMGRSADPGDVARLSPLIHGHIQLLGRYRFELPTPLSQGDYRQVTVPPG